MRWDRPQLNMRELEKQRGGNVSSERGRVESVRESRIVFYKKRERMRKEIETRENA